MTRIAFGVQPLPQSVTWDEWRECWLAADELGFDSLWSYDHVHAPRGEPSDDCFEGWMGMAALAALTRRARVGMLVSAVLFRNPALLVKMATTVDHITGGRSIYGLGAGWHVSEHESYGWGFPSPGERVSRLSEALQIAHAMWADPPGQPTTFAGRYYRVEGAHCNPAPLQRPRPPILVAGSGPRIIRLVARYADQYDSWPPLGDLRARYALLDEECEKLGRAPTEIVRSLSMDFLYEENAGRCDARIEAAVREQPHRDPDMVRARILAGDTRRMIETLQPFAEAGVSQVILHLPPPFDLKGLECFAREVVPAFC